MAKSEELEPKTPKDKLEPDSEPASEVEATSVPETSDAEAAEDAKTEKAVDDIMKNDGDEVLKAQDEAAEKAVVMKSSKWESFKNGWIAYWASPKKRWITIVGLVVVLGVLFGVPYTRYNILGVVLKGTVTVQVVDSKSGAPVSGAMVELSGKKAETQANGKAQLKVHAGTGSLKVSKKYYTGYSGNKLVALGSQTFKTTVVATGRQVTVKLVNKVTNKPLSGATITAGGANAKTDAKGMANLVIPSGATTQSASVSANGFNTTKVTITAGDNIAKNTFSVSPAGKLYFLSNQSGTIDVVKTNLDGSDRKTVLAGTGSEDRYSTSLLASRDWKYLALLSKRSGDKASIYLIDTTNGDKLSTIDEGDATFNLVGWSNDYFIYQVTRNTVSDWQNNQSALKSFDPTTDKTLLLDQTQGSGNSQNFYVKQTFARPYLIGDQVVYAKSWSGAGVGLMNDKAGSLDSISADGSGHKILKTFPYAPAASAYYGGINIVTRLYEPEALYVGVNSDGNNQTFYEYEDGKVTTATDMDNNRFYQATYPTYLLSPAGSSTFWGDPRDGKTTLFLGDKDAKTPKQIASLSEYNTFGWYTDDYLLVSKNSSELYIMGKDGGAPLKITDYYKPYIDYQGYGGGYGGL